MKRNNQAFLLTLIITYLYCIPAQADKRHYLQQSEQYIDQARVIQVIPVYRQTTNSQHHCNNYSQSQHYYNPSQMNHRDYGGIIVGGIIGGATGSRFGKGHGKQVATVAGTIVGAMIGDSMAADRSTPKYSQRHNYRPQCAYHSEYHHTQQIVAYKVKYRYKGRYFWTRTHQHPGRFIDVNIQIRPLS